MEDDTDLCVKWGAKEGWMIACLFVAVACGDGGG